MRYAVYMYLQKYYIYSTIVRLSNLSLSQWPTGFLQCFDAVGWVVWPVKIVPEMIYNVSSGTLSLYTLS